MTVGQPLTFPLAGLILEQPGATRTWDVSGVTIPLPDDLRLAEPIEGSVRVARTNRGVLVDAPLRTAIAGECSRCLRAIDIPIRVRIAEEVLPSIDIGTGLPLDATAEPDVVRLDDHHELHLGDLVGEAISLAEPIAPLCSPDCPGLCSVCGERLDEGHVAHAEDEIDPRLEALRSFRVDVEDENR